MPILTNYGLRYDFYVQMWRVRWPEGGYETCLWWVSIWP